MRRDTSREPGSSSPGTEEAPVFDATLSRQVAQRRLARAFADAGIDTADLDARLLLCAALKIDHVSLVRDPDSPIETGDRAISAFCARRLKREPVSRILGHREFWGLDFAINPAVLDPRPDTETLIEAALDLMRGRHEEPLRLLDLGAGSGAIIAALLTVFPNAIGYGIELLPPAAATAKANLERLGLAGRGSIICSDWTSALRGSFDLIVSNPPYIASGEIAGLAREVSGYDPHLALDGGPDGLEAYRSLAETIFPFLAPHGSVAFECGHAQARDIDALLTSAGLSYLGVRRDVAGHERVIMARRPAE
jgi:release factor glutamine methyltransferase